jgi:hypothetical protein
LYHFSAVYADLLRSEEEFVNDLRHMIDTYVSVFDDPNTPIEVRNAKDTITANLKELYNFHAKCAICTY